jgi:transcriptional regulator with XRE-family HTH domain
MKTKHTKPQYLSAGKKRLVVLAEDEYKRLTEIADNWEPNLPEPNMRGNYPLEALAIVLARDIIRSRRRLGLSQAELARRARIRPETLNRIEMGKNAPSVATIDKIDRALKAVEAGTERKRGSRRLADDKTEMLAFLRQVKADVDSGRTAPARAYLKSLGKKRRTGKT